RVAALGDRAEPVDPVPDGASPGGGGGAAGDLRGAGGGAGAVRGGLRLRSADDAGELRRALAAARAGGVDLGVQPGAGVLVGGSAGDLARGGDGGGAGVGAGAGGGGAGGG